MDAYFCFVHQPSTCPDLIDSVMAKEKGQKLSAEACKDDPNTVGKSFILTSSHFLLSNYSLNYFLEDIFSFRVSTFEKR